MSLSLHLHGFVQCVSSCHVASNYKSSPCSAPAAQNMMHAPWTQQGVASSTMCHSHISQGLKPVYQITKNNGNLMGGWERGQKVPPCSWIVFQKPRKWSGVATFWHTNILAYKCQSFDDGVRIAWACHTECQKILCRILTEKKSTLTFTSPPRKTITAFSQGSSFLGCSMEESRALVRW